MNTLIVVFFLVIGVELSVAQEVPYDLKLEMTAEQPEYRESKPISPFLVAAVLYFPKAKLWVVTKVRMIEPNYWTFRTRDIDLIMREVKGKLQTLYERKEET